MMGTCAQLTAHPIYSLVQILIAWETLETI